jgi:SAM-dependent methyltransferase
MKRAYWDRLATLYSDKVLEITAIDAKGLLARTAESFGGADAVAADFGCGIGATTRVFAPFFKRVIGVDFSPKLLEEAKRQTRATNVSYVLADLAAEKVAQIEADVGFCVNCLIAPSHEIRMRIARNIAKCVVGRGKVAFVVPSLESVLRTYHALIRLDAADGASRRQATQRITLLAKREVRSIAEGVVEIGGEPTKHYLGDEIAEFLTDAGFKIDTIDRVEYGWDVELDFEFAEESTPEASPGERQPWDWLLVGEAP